MSHRKMLYGYRYQSAELSPQPEEAETVRHIFAMYLDGETYQKIADTLNGEQIPFSSEDANWNKHKIKRLLENPRYGGADGYPPIVDSQTCQTALSRILEKNAHLRQTRPVLRLRDRLWCAECGKKLTVATKAEHRDSIVNDDNENADEKQSENNNNNNNNENENENENENGNGRNDRSKREAQQDSLHIKCRTCKWELDLPDRTLLTKLKRRAVSASKRTGEPLPYTPSAEVVRLTNAVNRGLEKPDHPEEILALILQGVSARYDCCADTTEVGPALPAKADIKTIIQRVSRIDISKNGKTAVTFRTEQGR